MKKETIDVIDALISTELNLIGLVERVYKFTDPQQIYPAKYLGGVCKAQGHIHRAIVTRDYWGFQLHVGELQPTIRTSARFLRLPPPFGLETHCPSHCMPRVAQSNRAIQTCLRPFLPHCYQCSPIRVPLLITKESSN